MDHINYIKKCIDHISNGGKMVFDRRPRRMSIERRLEIQIIDKIEQQVQYCFRTCENEHLEDKIIDLVRDWFLKGFHGGRDYQNQQESKKGT